MSADSLTTQVTQLIGSRRWNCEFVRVRATLSRRAIESLEGSGNTAAAQVYVDAVMADVLLDQRIGLERQRQLVIMRHRTMSPAPSQSLDGDQGTFDADRQNNDELTAKNVG